MGKRNKQNKGGNGASNADNKPDLGIRRDGAFLVSCPENEYDAQLQNKISKFISKLGGPSKFEAINVSTQNEITWMSSSIISGEDGNVDKSKRLKTNNDKLTEAETENFNNNNNNHDAEKQQQAKICVKVYDSPKSHFRMRTNFGLWRSGHGQERYSKHDSIYYCMYEQGAKERIPYEIKTFPRGSLLINKLMKDVLKKYVHDPQSETIRFKLFEVRFLSTLSGEAVVVLLYHAQLNETWTEKAKVIAKELGVTVVGRSRKQKIVISKDRGVVDKDDEDYENIKEVYTVDGKNVYNLQTEGAFSQPNGIVCQKMLEWALEAAGVENTDTDLLELYCGGATFTSVLCRNFRKVLATEISKASVALAKKNLNLNSIENVSVVRLSSEEFSEAYTATFSDPPAEHKYERRLKENNIDFKSFNLQTVFVDPPRAGMDEGTCRLISQFKRIIYISCNPDTLVRDLEILKQTHSIKSVAAFDQFPYTHHLECGVLLESNKR